MSPCCEAFGTATGAEDFLGGMTQKSLQSFNIQYSRRGGPCRQMGNRAGAARLHACLAVRTVHGQLPISGISGKFAPLLEIALGERLQWLLLGLGRPGWWMPLPG